jgi:hypothetical protein
MKRLVVTAGLLYSIHLSIYAQIPTLEQVDRLLNFGESAFPELLAPAAMTNQTEAIGSNWFYRDYGFLAPIPGGTGLAVAINISGGAGFTPGDVYAIGGDFGAEPVLVDSLANLLTLVPGSPPGGESGIIEPGNGNCVAFRFPEAGTQATYELQTAIFDEELQPTGEFTASEQIMLWVEVMSDQTTTRTEQMFTVEGGEQTTVNDLTQFWEFADELRFLNRMESNLVTTINIPAVINEVQETVSVTAYDAPGMLAGPNELCEGMVYFSASVPGSLMTTIHINDELFNEVDTPTSSIEFTAEVNSVDTELTVPGGTFDTVKVTTTNDAGTSVNWFDVGTGLPVFSQVFDPSNNLTSSSTLQEVTN